MAAVRPLALCALAASCAPPPSDLGGSAAARDAGVSRPGDLTDAGPPEIGVTSTDPLWPDDVPLPAGFDLPPWITAPAPGVVSLGWQSVEPVAARVELTPTEGDLEVDWVNARRIDSPDLTALHHVALDDLLPATGYRYRVVLGDADGSTREGVFVTPGAETWRFLHLGEFHAPSDALRVTGFTDEIRAHRPHVIVESGDMLDDGSNPVHWQSYLRTSAPWISNVILLPSHSNHVNGPLGNPYIRSLFELPDNERWYSTRIGALEIVTLDSAFTLNPDVATEPAWLRDRLAASLAADDPPRLILLSWHYPACSSSYKGREGERRWVLDNLVASLSGVDRVGAILVGHDKYYERAVVRLGDVEVMQVMANAGRLAPGKASADAPECETLRTWRDHRSLGLYFVERDHVLARYVDRETFELDRFVLPMAR